MNITSAVVISVRISLIFGVLTGNQKRKIVKPKFFIGNGQDMPKTGHSCVRSHEAKQELQSH